MALAVALVFLVLVLVAAPWLLLLVGAPLWAPLAIDLTLLLTAVGIGAVKWNLTRLRAKKLAPSTASKPARDALSPDVAVLDDVRRDVDAAVGTITRSQLAGGGRAALGALPWYVVLGPPGSGKSSLLRGSGLAFPSAPREPRRGDVPNAGGRPLAGTRRVDVWLANEAVLMDTAGRWSVASDATEWSAFLERLARHRGARALDGAILALAIDEVASASEADRSALARQLRARIEELAERFGVAVPVYVVFTKCDRLVGFNESFAGLDKRARARPWGATLERVDAGDLDELIRGELQELVRALRARVPSVLASERRLEARALAAELPAHFAATIDPIANLLTQMFVASVYGETSTLRGLYFTSATQEGRASDRLLDVALRASGVEAPVPATPSLEPRSYFVQQVLTRVAFADADTAAPSARARRRRSIAQVSTGATIAMLAGVFAIASAFSWRGNRQSIDALSHALAAIPTTTTLASPDALTPLRAALVRLREQRESPSLSLGFGLSRTSQVEDVARRRYTEAMRRTVLAPLLARDATELETWGATFETELDREPTEPERIRALALLERQLRFSAPIDPGEPTLDSRGAAELAHALADGWCSALTRPVAECEPLTTLLLDVASDASRPRVDRHERAVQVARLGLGRTSARAAAIDALVSAAAGRGYDLTLARMIGTAGRALTSERHVRGAFTRRGWEEVVRARLEASSVDADRAWILGAPRPTGARPEDELRRMYFDAFVEEWRTFLSSIRVGVPTDATESLALLEDLTRGTPPPLGRLLAAVDDNAHLAALTPEAESESAGATLFDSLTTRLGGGTSTATVATASVNTSADSVATALAPYTHFAVRAAGTPEDAPLGVDVYRDELALLRDALATYRDDTSASAALDTRLVAARRRVDGLITEQAPGARDFFERVLRPPVEAAALTSARAIASAVGAGFCSAVTTPYASSLGGHYPFAAHGDDAPLGEVAAFYRPGGTLWSYYDSSLVAIAPRAGGRFALARADRDSGPAYTSQLVAFLDRSQTVTRGLFPPGGAEPRVELDVRIHPTSGAASVRFSVGGATIDYRNGPESWTRVVWPGASPSAGARLEVESARGLSERLAQDGEWGLFRYYWVLVKLVLSTLIGRRTASRCLQTTTIPFIQGAGSHVLT